MEILKGAIISILIVISPSSLINYPTIAKRGQRLQIFGAFQQKTQRNTMIILSFFNIDKQRYNDSLCYIVSVTGKHPLISMDCLGWKKGHFDI